MPHLNLYGLTLATAIIISAILIEKKVTFPKIISSDQYWTLVTIIVLFGVIGARVYHLITDWQLYADSWWQMFYIWRGGLSIVGAVFGGGGAGVIWLKFNGFSKKIILQMLDSSIFGLPIGQAIGRWGNYFNQELYGLPTDLPWGIFIQPAKRFVGFENFIKFHPLFFYESFAMICFSIWVWIFYSRRKSVKPGRLFGFYLLFYATIRFLLEFLRIDKKMLGLLSFNQWVMIGLVIGSIWWVVGMTGDRKQKIRYEK